MYSYRGTDSSGAHLFHPVTHRHDRLLAAGRHRASQAFVNEETGVLYHRAHVGTVLHLPRRAVTGGVTGK